MNTERLTPGLREYLSNLDQETAQDVINLLQKNGRHTPRPPTTTSLASKSHAPLKVKKKRLNKGKSELSSGGPKRPLNSWMAFRNYYSVLLTNYTQKATSKVLTEFWQADPFKAKWTILAKAYSIVRGKRDKIYAPLDGFLAACAPVIGVIAPNNYLNWMGWHLSTPLGGDQLPIITRKFDPQIQSFPSIFTASTVSAEDLVAHCRNIGYFVDSQPVVHHDSTQVSLVMATSPSNIEPSTFSEERFLETLVETVDTNPNAFLPATNGLKVLKEAESQLTLLGVGYPYCTCFDPTSKFTTSFDPCAADPTFEDGGVWNAFEMMNGYYENNFQASQDLGMFTDNDMELVWQTLVDGPATA